MFTDYRAQVLEDYRKKKDRNELSLNLTLSTPAKLRNECLAVLSARYSAKDEKTLRLFFGARDSAADYEQAIRKIDIDKFRPLKNLLSDHTIGTDEKNIELLAWLIDFQPRPYPLGFVPAAATDNLSEETGKKAPEKETGNLNPPGEGSGLTRLQKVEKTLLKNQKRLVILFLIVVIVGPWPPLLLTQYFEPQECMYWNGDVYKPISCNRTVHDASVLALDAAKVKNFKKIALTDTITRHSLGYVWYSKIDNRLEFFTSDGFHPTHDDRRLKPITEYIINRYLSGNKKTSER